MPEDAMHEQTQTKGHSVSSGPYWQGEQCCLNVRHDWNMAGIFLPKLQTDAKRRTQQMAQPSTVITLNTKHEWYCSLLVFGKVNVGFYCDCSMTRSCDCGFDCESQRWSSRMSFGCNSCRWSNCDSCSCFGWCSDWGCDCDSVWRGCSRMIRWWIDCWMKDWAGSKG